MRITNLNPDHDIGASAWHVNFEGHGLLLDAGVHPKREGNASLPLLGKLKDDDVDAIVISHCHHDHVGGLPVAVRKFPQAHVMMTELSYFLVERVLHNSVNVMERQKTELGIREYPLFTHEEVDDYAAVFQGFKYRRPIDWAPFHRTRGKTNAPTLEFVDAGHTLGSAGVLVRGARETLFYSGDVCFHDQTMLRGAQYGDVRADVLILETTRGARDVPKGFTRAKELDRLCEAMRGVLKRNGSVLIPAFALGRTQELLAQISIWMDQGRLPRKTVHLGGLGRVFTEIYDLESHRANRNLSGLRLTEALDLRVTSPNHVQSMRLGGGQIFVITAGMMNANTAAHDLAARMAGDERHGIFFVGYADPDAPGGRFKQSRLGKPFFFSDAAGDVTRRCQMEDFDLTAHANRDELVQLVETVDPKVVILGHGDGPARAWMAAEIRRRYPRVKVVEPGPGESVEG